jgi:hypothetical protein
VNRRRGALVAVLVALPLLAGCDVDARVIIESDEVVNVDVTSWAIWNWHDESGADTIEIPSATDHSRRRNRAPSTPR